ncbi:hypothetical protein AMAG_13987 [Allomyces macrogynus ATCC 38327]|uniref:Large ribosomal subunit protein bL28m n=1 Tax=Allomyces macrogynus (strain ATCC 38327) TaxID=578462 RepID=A0A0L0T321_ALLM3|nr:hypothetical protein AMAG_13987 [Allomyces macrogynus ATCC 38327]|eukprot:KNE69131.1 hypothetical protein AMAG_13987 [Allomyces macrogynus ATCC 38327]
MSFLSTITRSLFRANSGTRPNRADTGLLGGLRVLSGNKKSHAGNKMRRMWKPNVHKREIYSLVLDTHLDLHVSSKVLRTIDKKGGLDAYLLTTPNKKIDSALGVQIKEKIVAKLKEAGKEPKVV